jgi:TonB-dependent starch-binding outer membrane protein SusC
MRKTLCLLLGVLLTVTQLLAQNRTITGTVRDNNGNPLSNASVQIKGTNLGTVTNASGVYTLSVPSNARTIVISSVDMTAQEVAIGSQTQINVSLQGAERNLQEVVVVGYGVQQKRAFTGSASKVDVKQFSNLVTPSVDKQLAGRAAGVQVVTSGGLVNAPARIRVRGVNSISQNNDPLIVVDGVPIISGNLALATNSNTLGDINPSDIESLEVLKDGSATAIYGSRAAAGVILITTKRGASGKARVSYDGFVGYSSVLKKFDLLNAQEFVMIANEKLANVGSLPRAGVNPGGVNFDWQDEIFVKNAPVQNHTLSLQGGINKTNYYFSLNYSDQKGVIFSNSNKSYRSRFNLDHEVNKFVKVGNSLTLSRQYDKDQNNGSNSLGGSVASTLRLLPNVSAYDTSHPTGFNIAFPNGNSMKAFANTQSVDDNFQNVAFTLRNNQTSSDKYRIFDVFYVELSPFKGFKFRTQLSADVFNDYSFQTYDPRHGDGGGATNGLAYNANQYRLRTVMQNYANYNLTLNKHSFFLTAGHEVQRDDLRQVTSQATNIAELFFLKENLITGSGTIQTVGGTAAKAGFESVFGRINYDFKNKYFAQASIRRDGQSSLAADKRYGTFPGFSVGWRISQEDFWNPINDKVNELKLKASYATVGNSLGGFPYLSTFGLANYGNIGGVAPNLIGNADLQWETSKKYDIGLEASFLQNRLGLSLDLFRNDIDNQVLDVPTPLSAGVPGSAIKQNLGTSRNKGVEVSVNAAVINRGDFTWNINANYTKVSNEVFSLYSINEVPITEINIGNFNLIRIGDPMNIIYGYRYAGVNTANGNPMYLNAKGQLIQHNIATGTYHFAADRNDATLGGTTSLAITDKVNLGNTIPKYFGAVTNSFGFKNFNLEVMVRYSGGNKVYNYTRQDALFSQGFHNNSREILNRWTTPGQVTDVPKLYFAQSNAVNQANQAISRFVEDGDFIKLQNVILSYTIDTKKISQVTNGYLSGVRIYLQGQNLYTWSDYKGSDPENYNTLGVDMATSPQVRTISAGISVGF